MSNELIARLRRHAAALGRDPSYSGDGTLTILSETIAALSAQPSGVVKALEWEPDHGTAALGSYRLFQADTPIGKFSYGTDAEGNCYWHSQSGGVFVVGDEEVAKRQAEAAWTKSALTEASKFIALSRPASVEGGEPVAAPFGLSSDDVEALRSNGLKPEEIAGDPTAQAKRVRELLHWFSRLSRKSANPKWTTEHAFELAYYIATTDDRAAFDISAVEREAWKKGLQEPAEVRDMAVRHGWIPSPVPASGTPALAHPAKPAVQDGIECHGLDTPERVCFYEQDFYVLSNFSAFNVTWAERRKFQTAEHCYHWLKFATLKGSPGNWTLSDESAAIAKSIAEAPSAHEAFKIAERNRRLRRPDWDDVKVEFMRKIIRAKAAQHEYVRRKLLATGDRELVENSWRDDFWGWGPNRDGKNMLGKLWMEVRAEIRAASPAPQEPASPSDEVKP